MGVGFCVRMSRALEDDGTDDDAGDDWLNDGSGCSLDASVRSFTASRSPDELSVSAATGAAAEDCGELAIPAELEVTHVTST